MVVEVRGIPVNYICCGEGEETAVILQGWGTNLGLYRDLAQHLGGRMRVYVPELPGFGETPEPREPMDAEDYAAFTLDLLRALGIRETHLIGHSNGGRIMLVLASEERDVRLIRRGSCPPRRRRRSCAAPSSSWDGPSSPPSPGPWRSTASPTARRTTGPPAVSCGRPW